VEEKLQAVLDAMTGAGPRRIQTGVSKNLYPETLTSVQKNDVPEKRLDQSSILEALDAFLAYPWGARARRNIVRNLDTKKLLKERASQESRRI
jgi:hypothetical protein